MKYQMMLLNLNNSRFKDINKLVDYTNLALTEYPNVHFVGDALSARGITVSGAQGIYVAESLLN